ncbi:MAG: hypothetical protein CL624_13025 [Arcobacter sp.]|nr:hypothetical protein [Arcobacter sp.]
MIKKLIISILILGVANFVNANSLIEEPTFKKDFFEKTPLIANLAKKIFMKKYNLSETTELDKYYTKENIQELSNSEIWKKLWSLEYSGKVVLVDILIDKIYNNSTYCMDNIDNCILSINDEDIKNRLLSIQSVCDFIEENNQVLENRKQIEVTINIKNTEGVITNQENEIFYVLDIQKIKALYETSQVPELYRLNVLSYLLPEEMNRLFNNTKIKIEYKDKTKGLYTVFYDNYKFNLDIYKQNSFFFEVTQ